MDIIEKLVEDQVIALIPLYLNMKGNCTKIITLKDREVYIYKSIKTVIGLLARYFTLDLNASRKYYGSLIGSKNVVPIPLNREDIFIPIKVRKPISKNDGALGYVNLRYIEDIKFKNGEVYIMLKDNSKIKSLQSIDSVEKHIRDGKLVKKIIDNKNNLVIMEHGGDFYVEFNKPATKGDIAALRNELIDLKSRLGR